MPSRPPSVDALARSLADLELPHALLVDAARAAIAAGDPSAARGVAEALAEALLRPVINATGVLLHTNLGRAPLAPQAGTHLRAPIRYSNLEFDLATGRRGSRHRHAASLLARAAGAEAALVVNNGAAAILLAVTALAEGGEVVVSRGELVEIGGGFRVPDVLAASGARLVEVGTTNRTRTADYATAVTPATTLLLKVHQSNYRIVGFTASASISEVAAVGAAAGAAEAGPLLIADIGSGLLDATTPWLPGGPPPWLGEEPAARQTLAAGAALVTFSGDKLLGGPQAGILAGRRDLVERCAQHPLARALRPGGLVLEALQRTALAYLRRDLAALPFWSLATAPLEPLQGRARAIAEHLGRPEFAVTDCVSVPGGGSLPGIEIPSAGVRVEGDRTAALRSWDPPVIARTHDGATICDLRAVDPDDDAILAEALHHLAP